MLYPNNHQKIADLPGFFRSRGGGFSGTKPSGGVWLALILWLALLAGALVGISYHTHRPGPSAAASARWPLNSRIPRDATVPTLVLFAHPHCPCTRATLGELAVLMAQAQGKLHAEVCFLKPVQTPEAWTNTDLWRAAAAIPGVSVQEDRDGLEARLFGAETSGEARLFQTDGRLEFQGGITASRGHAGDNDGRAAIAALVAGEHPAMVRTPVFGCSLFATNCRKEEGAGKP